MTQLHNPTESMMYPAPTLERAAPGAPHPHQHQHDHHDLGDTEPALSGDPIERPSLKARTASFLAVTVPLVGLLVAIILLWGVGFSWLHLGLLAGGYFFTAIGITIGYHRLFTHKSFRTSATMKVILGALGSMALEGPILDWVAMHRRHHQHSDRHDDPHSPHGHGDGFIALIRGFAHAHIGWFFAPGPTAEVLERYVPDLQADAATRRTSKLFPLWVVLGLAIPTAIALAVTGTWTGALLGFIWGGLVRIFLVHHVTWSINSVCHLWGSQPFKGRDHSRNNIVFGLLGMGEGWHNNHHAFPASARHGLAWWQFDASYLIIRLMAACGLVDEIRIPSPERIASRMANKPTRE